MSIERSIHLDLGMPPKTDLQEQTDSGTSAQKDARNPAQLQQDVQAFEASLKGPSRHVAADTALPASPMMLFGQASLAPAVSPPATRHSAEATPAAFANLESALSQLASRLLVGQGRNGATAVHIQLESETLPGVALEVFQGDGALVAQFICSNETSRERLVRAVAWLAQSLAQRLCGDVLVRVLADDPEDPSPVESRAQAPI